MKAFSLIQPWASLMAVDEKRIETRRFQYTYRGPVAIHASKVMPRRAREICFQPPFRDVLHRHGFLKVDGHRVTLGFPVGVIIAVANLYTAARTEHIVFDLAKPAESNELAFGDYTSGRWGFFTNGLKPLRDPIPCKGSLGLWTVPDDIVERIQAQLQGARR